MAKRIGAFHEKGTISPWNLFLAQNRHRISTFYSHSRPKPTKLGKSVAIAVREYYEMLLDVEKGIVKDRAINRGLSLALAREDLRATLRSKRFSRGETSAFKTRIIGLTMVEAARRRLSEQLPKISGATGFNRLQRILIKAIIEDKPIFIGEKKIGSLVPILTARLLASDLNSPAQIRKTFILMSQDSIRFADEFHRLARSRLYYEAAKPMINAKDYMRQEFFSIFVEDCKSCIAGVRAALEESKKTKVSKNQKWDFAYLQTNLREGQKALELLLKNR